jgi:hypothetical protein
MDPNLCSNKKPRLNKMNTTKDIVIKKSSFFGLD